MGFRARDMISFGLYRDHPGWAVGKSEASYHGGPDEDMVA